MNNLEHSCAVTDTTFSFLRSSTSYTRKIDETEAVRYLQTPPLPDSNPLDCWKVIESSFPTLAQMARDILAIPATGVGVERLFNIGRDTCHYRRNRLNGKTIENIMLIKYADRIGVSPTKEPSDQLQLYLTESDEREGEAVDDICQWEHGDLDDICQWENLDDDLLESTIEVSEGDDLPSVGQLVTTVSTDI